MDKTLFLGNINFRELFRIDFFAGINFRELFISKFFANINFREYVKNVQNSGMVENIPGYEDRKYKPAQEHKSIITF